MALLSTMSTPWAQAPHNKDPPHRRPLTSTDHRSSERRALRRPRCRSSEADDCRCPGLHSDNVSEASPKCPTRTLALV